MRTMRLESLTGVTGTCGYEAYRGRLYIVLSRNGERLTCEIQLGEMSSRCQLSGKTLDAARARWEAANVAKPERSAKAKATRREQKRRASDRKRKTKSHGVRSLMREPAEPVDDAAVLVTAAGCDLVPLIVNRERAPKLDFPEEW